MCVNERRLRFTVKASQLRVTDVLLFCFMCVSVNLNMKNKHTPKLFDSSHKTRRGDDNYVRNKPYSLDLRQISFHIIRRTFQLDARIQVLSGVNFQVLKKTANEEVK